VPSLVWHAHVLGAFAAPRLKHWRQNCLEWQSQVKEALRKLCGTPQSSSSYSSGSQARSISPPICPQLLVWRVPTRHPKPLSEKQLEKANPVTLGSHTQGGSKSGSKKSSSWSIFGSSSSSAVTRAKGGEGDGGQGSPGGGGVSYKKAGCDVMRERFNDEARARYNPSRPFVGRDLKALYRERSKGPLQGEI
jgi:hypothetical protein